MIEVSFNYNKGISFYSVVKDCLYSIIHVNSVICNKAASIFEGVVLSKIKSAHKKSHPSDEWDESSLLSCLSGGTGAGR